MKIMSFADGGSVAVDRVQHPWRLRLYRHVNERNALAVALLLAALAGIGDAATDVDVAFTLFYFLPIAVASWFRGRQGGAVIVTACIVFSGLTDVLHVSAGRPLTWTIVWNMAGEAVIFIIYCDTVARLRARVDREINLRASAVGELRHAERLNTVGKLAAGLAHELGTPLHVVAGRAELIAHGDLAPNDLLTSALIIGEQTSRMARIIRSMLDFGRRSGTDKRTEDVGLLAEQTAELLRALAHKSGIDIVVAGSHVRAEVNRAELQQVLSNLLSNAIQAMQDGGRIMVCVEDANVKLAENADTRVRSYVCIEVRDQGTGIPPEILPRIFDPFFTTKDVGEGTGLGLSVSYGIVRDHGGAMRIETLLGRGTTVRVYLPH